MATCVIVGAGQAGAWLARTLRAQDAAARIVLVGDEAAAPYERPPLSKEVLKGDALPSSTTILSRDVAQETGVELWLGERVVRIEREAHRLVCASGRTLQYDTLFLATGSRNRELSLPGVPAERVHGLRTLDDARRLREGLSSAARILVVGGGWIGLEVASVAREMGKSVTVLEAGPRLCARAVPPVVSEYLLRLHRGRGVEVRLNAHATVSWDGTAVRADMSEGAGSVVADRVVAAVGIVPNVELALECGLPVDNGIVVDARGRTTDPAIFAAGDVTCHPCRHAGRSLRLESWDNAQNQAMAVARAALDALAPAYDAIPWFWSDQYDVNLQILGMTPMGVTPQQRGDPATGKCLWLFWEQGRVASVIGVNAGREIRIVKKWMEQGRYPDPAAACDETVPLQKLPLRALQADF